MKRLLSFLLTGCLLLSLCACGIIPPEPDSGTPDNTINDNAVLSPPEVDDPTPPDSGADTTPPDDDPPPPPDESVVDPGQEDETQTPDDNSETEGNEEQEEYIRTIDPYAPMVALTFDDGPHELYSTQILDVLEQYHAVATFFEVGYNARLYPDILRRMVDLGCELASHSNAHHDLTTLSRDAMLTDLAKLDQIIYDATGITPTLVRPPYGAVNSTVKYESGRAMMLWTVDTRDWYHRDAQVLIEYFQNYGDLDGEVVLMHSIHASTAEAMATVIPWLIEQGYQLVTVSELMAYYYGELLEANHYYNQNYFAKRARTEYPLELPSEPMQTDIPPYNTVPVVPNTKPDDQPDPPPTEDPPEQPPEQPPENETPTPDDPPPVEDPDEPTLPPDNGDTPTDEPDPPQDSGDTPTDEPELPQDSGDTPADEPEPPQDNGDAGEEPPPLENEPPEDSDPAP